VLIQMLAVAMAAEKHLRRQVKVVQPVCRLGSWPHPPESLCGEFENLDFVNITRLF
jgi:hypothetical protein